MQGQGQGQGPRPQGPGQGQGLHFYNVQGLARTLLWQSPCEYLPIIKE